MQFQMNNGRLALRAGAAVAIAVAICLYAGRRNPLLRCDPPPSHVMDFLNSPELRLPCAVVDLDSFDANAQLMVGAIVSAAKQVRIATKSIRCVHLIDRVVAAVPAESFAGLMTFTAKESIALAAMGKYKHILLAYPTANMRDAAEIAESCARGCPIAVMVDCVAHARLLHDAAVAAGVVIPIWVDVDMSYRPMQLESVHIGVRRSGLRSPQDKRLQELLAFVAQPGSHVRIEGTMGYEAQLAGLQDRVLVSGGALQRAAAAVEGFARRFIKKRSEPELQRRRAALREVVGAALPCNGGGSGSIDSTCADPCVTEVTVGSGALAGHLFDGYDGSSSRFRPTLYFALR